MKKKFLGRVLTMLLVASMVFTLLPAPAIAAGNWWWNNGEYTEEAVPTATADENYHYNIFFLDCGRKYYSVDSIKQLIDNASAVGFNYIQLAVGNDGLRLLLDDMNLTVGDNTYGSEDVKAAIHAGNLAYNAGFEEKDGHKTYGPEKNELTEGEMNAIIAYAKSKGMGVIPCVNTPGHMDAILSAANALTGTNCSYNGSVRTIDVTNATAVAFTKALLQKYIAYFQSQGCQLFNMGADEYANDKYATGSMGFGNLQSSGNYSYYVTYVNAVAAMIKAAKMTPMAFNDGIYFNNNTWSGTFDTDIIICYWSNGWSGYTPMPAATLADKGFKLVNTNGAYYWVLGKADAQCDASKAAQFNYLDFPRGEKDSSVSESAGSMFCIWADYPGDETEASVISKTADTIAAFGSKLPKLNTTPVQPDTGITIKPEGGTTGKLDSTKNESIVLDAGKVVTWSYDPALVELTSADAPSEVALANLETLRAQRVTVTPVAGASGTATITAADENGNRDTFPIEVVNSAATTDGPIVDLKVGQTSDKYTVVGNVTDQVDETDYDAKVATYQATPRTETTPGGIKPTTEINQYFYIRSSNNRYLDNTANWERNIEKAAQWKCISNGDGYFIQLKDSSPAKFIISYGLSWGTTEKISGIGSRTKFSFDGNQLATSTLGTVLGTPVVKTEPITTAYTDITFTGKAEGTTSVTIGGTRYTINVSYYEQPVNVVLDQSTPVTVSGALNTDGLDTNVATVSVSTDGKTMTVNGVAEGNTSVIVGNTKYLITVSTEDLEAVPPLKIEYWITNKSIAIDGAKKEERKKVLNDDKYPVYYQNILATAANSEEGVMIDTYAPSPATVSKTTYVYWLSRILDTKKPNTTGSGTEAQTADNGDDETQSGSAFSKIRYHQSKWSVFTENNEWVDVDAKHQLVAYYMQLTEVTNEVTTTVVDWGVPPSQLTWNKEDFALLDFSVKYESGERLPNTFANEKTVAYALDRTVTERHIGRINAIETAEYEVYMITVTPNNDNKNVSVADAVDKVTSGGYTYDGTEKVIWVDKEENLGDFADTTLHATGFRVGGEASIVDGITMNKKQGVLVTYYLRTKVTEDSLTVNYVNQTTGEQFYSYNIAVASGTAFKPTIRLDNPAERNLLDGDVINIKGVIQNVTADLIKMPGVPAQYRYSKYQCKELVRNNDKTITLYYTFNNSVGFVVDFGLPLTIAPKDVNEKLALSGVTIDSVKVENVTYGTCSIDGTNFTYTPGKDFVSSGSGEALTVKYTGQIFNEETNEIQQSTVAYQVYIYPASNVLYEASFLTRVDKDNGPVWTLTTAASKTQETQKVGDTTTKYAVFGRDTAYDEAYGALGAWQLGSETQKLEDNAFYANYLTTQFYGNAFDLIGNCGPTTGLVSVLISGKNGIRIYDVDTRYNDGNNTTLYQVPLAHIDLGKEDDTYTVKVYGSGLKATGETPASYSLRGAATYASDYAVGGHNAVLSGILAENGLTMADVEYVKVESAPAAAKTARRAASFYAPDTAAETGTVTHAPGTHVEIDGFRVYRSANNTNYPTSEQNVQYLNILDAVGSFTAFVEGSTADRKWEVRDQYENAGGPQNEIYLRKTNGENSAIAFKIDPNAIVQISARAVENKKAATLVVNGTETVIATNTEMYYTVKANERGIVTIKNTGEGMLALGNLKIKNGTQAAALSEEDYPAAIALLSLNAAPETPDTVFEPTISAKVTTTRFIRSKVVTLTVSASADVAKLTVNGKELRPTNGWLVSMGWSKSYNYILTETVKKSETKTYEIIGYSADGTPSTPTVVKSK